MRIYIPTFRRVDNQKTFNNLQQEVSSVTEEVNLQEENDLNKNQIKKLTQNFTDFGFDRGFEVMRYVPLAERPSRTQPPPPPPRAPRRSRRA